MNGARTNWVWQSPPGWPPAPPGWQPSLDWQPDPTWPAPPPDWQWWAPAGKLAAGAAPWFIAAGLMVPLAMVLLVAGLQTASLTLVYVSIACSAAWLPLLVVGLVKVLRSR